MEEPKPIKKKINSLLFILAATLVNLGINVAVFLILIWLYKQFLAWAISDPAQAISYEVVSSIIFVVIFFISVASSYFLYHRIIKWLSNRVDMEKYFDPIFQFKGHRRRH